MRHGTGNPFPTEFSINVSKKLRIKKAPSRANFSFLKAAVDHGSTSISPNGLSFHIFNADDTQADTFFLHQKEKNVPRPSRRPHFTDALRRRCTTPTFSVSRAKATLTDMLLNLIILYDYTTNLLQMQPLFFTIFRPFIRQKMFLPFQWELPLFRRKQRLFLMKFRQFRGHSPHFRL